MQKKASSRRATAVRDVSLKNKLDEDSFKVRHIEEEREVPTMNAETDREMSEISVPTEDSALFFNEDNQISSIEPKTTGPQKEQEPKELVKVKFSKFVQLVTVRDCADVVANNENEDIIINSNLLTELASSHDEREEKKIPLVFLVGLAIGVIITYILITK